MSKPWFLDVAQDEAADTLRGKIKNVLGREMNEPEKVVEQARVDGTDLEKGEALKNRPDGAIQDEEGKIASGWSVSVESTSSASSGSEEDPVEGIAKLAVAH